MNKNKCGLSYLESKDLGNVSEKNVFKLINIYIHIIMHVSEIAQASRINASAKIVNIKT